MMSYHLAYCKYLGLVHTYQNNLFYSVFLAIVSSIVLPLVCLYWNHTSTWVW